MSRAFAALLVVSSFSSAAQAQDVCAPLRVSRCAVPPAPQPIPRFRQGNSHAPAVGTPSHRAAFALDQAWTLVEALPEIGAPDEARVARDALVAILAEYSHVDGMQLGNSRNPWPTEFALRQAIAELSWRIEDPVSCVEHFELLTRRYPASADRDDAAYVALLCHMRRLRMSTQARRPLRGDATDVRELTAAESALVHAVDRYACLQPGSDSATEASYYAARRYYEAARYEEAASRFRVIAESAPTSDIATLAANLYLDSLNMLARERPSCHVEMSAAVGRLTPIYCATAADQDSHPDLCGVLSQLVCDVARHEAEALSQAGDHLGARDRWVRIARTQRECGRLDEVLYNAAAEADAGGDTAGARRIRRVLRRNFPQSSLVGR